ncbi:AraC family transcriptional regulator [Niallia sp. 01092]|uniref:AraC family transcriptional regulator n=1 Tax=unclassified Niallia TaxID=2837522 RepID=UPI003FD1730C
MENIIYYCGYSYHTTSYFDQHKKGFPNFLFRLQTEGTAEVIVNGIKTEMKKGDLVLVKPGDIYEIRIEGDQKSGDYHLLCQGDWVKEWWNRYPKPSFSKINLDKSLLDLWNHIIMEERRPASDKNNELSSYLLQAFCISLERAINETSPSFNRPYSVTKMMRYIEENAMSGFAIEDVAKNAGLSVSRSVHLFKSSFGKTMIEYAQEIRLSAAINQMKYTTMTLEQIAENCGFGAYPYFHRIFKMKYGVSPGVYRKME